MAKINGQLEVAQAEQLAADPVLSPTGRLYMNIATPARALLKVYDGTQWQQIAYQSTSTLFSQNSGLAVTVDWSRGLNQEVILTNNALISFTNPQTGQTHRLVVTQKTYTTGKTLYQYKLNMTDQDPQRNGYQPVGAIPFGENQVYSWYYTAGIRAAYATVPQAMAAPALNIAALAGVIDFAPDNKSVVYSRAASPFLVTHQFFDAGSRASIMQFNQPAAPAAAAAQVSGVKYSPYQDVCFITSGTTPFLQSYAVVGGNATNIGVFANPGTLPAGAAQCLDVHPNGNYVICGHTTTPFMSAYPYDDAGFGTKVTNPGTLPAAQVNAVGFSPLGDYVAAVGATTPFLQVWPFDAVAGTFGTIIANPVTLPTTGMGALLGKGMMWRPQGDFIATGDGTNLYVTGFNRTTGAFTTQISAAQGASVLCVNWTPDGQYLLVGLGGAPFMRIYDFSAANLSTSVTFDIAAPTVQVNDMVVDKTGRYVVLTLNASPGVQTFPLPTKVRNYLRM